MGTTAKLYRITIADHTHIITVFLAEESHRAHSLSLGDRSVAVLIESDSLAHAAVGKGLYCPDFFRCKLLEVREVKAQDIGRHK